MFVNWLKSKEPVRKRQVNDDLCQKIIMLHGVALSMRQKKDEESEEVHVLSRSRDLVSRAARILQ